MFNLVENKTTINEVDGTKYYHPCNSLLCLGIWSEIFEDLLSMTIQSEYRRFSPTREFSKRVGGVFKSGEPIDPTQCVNTPLFCGHIWYHPFLYCFLLFLCMSLTGAVVVFYLLVFKTFLFLFPMRHKIDFRCYLGFNFTLCHQQTSGSAPFLHGYQMSLSFALLT